MANGIRTWLITGSSAGLGRAVAEEVLARGERLVATARDPGSLADLVARAPDRVLALPLDVTDSAQIDAAVAAATGRFGGVDILVNNAGYGLIGALEEVSDTELRAQFDVNLFGLAAVTRAVLPGMRARRSGHIVNLSSVMGVFAAPASSAYCASKFALEGLSESLALEVAPLGIGVTIVEPGAFRTDFSGRSIALAADEIADYEISAATRARMKALDGTQAGDPVRGAAIICDAVSGPNPPLRLVIGKAAIERVETVLRDRIAQLDLIRAVAPTADFPAA